jgi:hypothetical protein
MEKQKEKNLILIIDTSGKNPTIAERIPVKERKTIRRVRKIADK